MTIPSAVNKSGPYFYNGATTAFAYGFKISDASHIRVVETVIATGVETDLVLATDYTVTGVGNDTGTVVISPARAAGKIVVLVRSVPFTQLLDLENQGAYFAERVEAAFDAGVARDQQLQEQLSRAVMAPLASEIDPSELISSLEAASVAAVAAAAAAEDDANLADIARIAAEAAVATAAARLLNRAELAAKTLPSGVKVVELYGYRATGVFDRGARWRRMQTAPVTVRLWHIRSVDRFCLDGSTDATNGGYWELVERQVTPQMFGTCGAGEDVSGTLGILQSAADFSKDIYVPNGNYGCTGPCTFQGGTKIVGQARDQVVFQINTSWLDDTFHVSGAYVVENIWFFIPRTYVPGVTTTLTNRRISGQAHIGVTSGQNGLIKNNRIADNQYGIRYDGASLCIHEGNVFGGCWDHEVGGLQEAIASIDIGGAGTQLIAGINNYMGGGYAAPVRPVTHGSLTTDFATNIGPRFGYRVKSCEGLKIDDRYMGGHNENCVKVVPETGGYVTNVDIKVSFLDPSRFYSIDVTSTIASNLVIGGKIECLAKGQRNGDGFVKFSNGGTGTWCSQGWTIIASTAEGHLKTPIINESCKGLKVIGCSISGYNERGGYTGDPNGSAGILSTLFGTTKAIGNTFGGGLTTLDPVSNNCQYGFVGGVNDTVVQNDNAGLGLAGGSFYVTVANSVSGVTLP